MPSLILFDFDGVLAETHAPLNREFPAIFKEFLDPDDKYGEGFEELRHKLYKEHSSTLHGWAALHGLDAAWLMESQRITNKRVGQLILKDLTPNPGLTQKLQQLAARGHTLAILTHSHREYTLPLLQHLGLLGVFPPEKVYDLSAIRGGSKLHEETYRHVVNHLAEKPFLHHYMLEDTLINLAASKKLGFTNLLITQGEVPLSRDIDYAFAHINTAVDFLLAIH